MAFARPPRHGAGPAPFYAQSVHASYCQTCGRICSSKAPFHQTSGSGSALEYRKYCSRRCKNNKPDDFDSLIEQLFVTALDGTYDSLVATPVIVQRATSLSDSLSLRDKASGVLPRTILCSDIQTTVFGEAGQVLEEYPLRDHQGTGIPHSTCQPKQSSEERRLTGVRLAGEKERVKRAGRRLCVFGTAFATGNRDPAEAGTSAKNRKTEIVIGGAVVDPSFAKGDWGIRWR